jgi:hypothetical protein
VPKKSKVEVGAKTDDFQCYSAATSFVKERKKRRLLN